MRYEDLTEEQKLIWQAGYDTGFDDGLDAEVAEEDQ